MRYTVTKASSWKVQNGFHLNFKKLTLFNVVFRVKEDTYFCVLYNDEHHSYDHVIYTLQRAIACDQNQAQIYTALIDKEVSILSIPHSLTWSAYRLFIPRVIMISGAESSEERYSQILSTSQGQYQGEHTCYTLPSHTFCMLYVGCMLMTYLTIFAFPLQRNSEHIIQIPLRVEILHTAVMAHQTFSLRLGAWFQKIIGYSGR